MLFTYFLSLVPTLTMPVRPRLSSIINPVTFARRSRSASVGACISISAEISTSRLDQPSIRIDPFGAPTTESVPPTPKSSRSDLYVVRFTYEAFCPNAEIESQTTITTNSGRFLNFIGFWLEKGSGGHLKCSHIELKRA